MKADGTFKAKLKKQTTKAAEKGTERKSAATLEDAELEDDGRDWKVLKVQWSEEDTCILVYYYDVEEEADDNDLKTAMNVMKAI